jgi:hypothetical protein
MLAPQNMKENVMSNETKRRKHKKRKEEDIITLMSIEKSPYS